MCWVAMFLTLVHCLSQTGVACLAWPSGLHHVTPKRSGASPAQRRRVMDPEQRKWARCKAAHTIRRRPPCLGNDTYHLTKRRVVISLIAWFISTIVLV